MWNVDKCPKCESSIRVFQLGEGEYKIQYCELRQNFVAPYWSGHGPTAGCSAYVCQLRAWSPHITKQRLLVIGCRGMAGAQVAAKTWFNTGKKTFVIYEVLLVLCISLFVCLYPISTSNILNQWTDSIHFANFQSSRNVLFMIFIPCFDTNHPLSCSALPSSLWTTHHRQPKPWEEAPTKAELTD